MKRWWDGLKISHKIVWAFLGLIAFPFSLLLLWNFGSFAVQYEQQLSQSGQYMLGMVVQDVNEKLDHVEMLVHALSSNRRLISFLSHDYTGAASYEEYTQTVLPLLQGVGNTVSPPIDRIFLLTDNTSIPEGYSTVYHRDSAPEQLLLKIPEDGREDLWYVESQDGEQVLYYLCPIIADSRKSEGFLLVKMRGEKLFSEIGKPQEGGTALFLLDEENRPQFANVETEPGCLFPKSQVPRGPVRYFSAPLDRLPLQVGVALSAGEHGILQKNSLVTLAFMGILSFLFLSLFYSLVRSIIARLRRYGYDMERIAGDNFHGALAVDRRDEIGTIGEQFNRVLNRMRVLMRENIQKETAYKDAQLKALLLQINPHFIYNTLDMFAGKLTLDGEYEVADTMCDFAQMIRYNTTASSTMLPLREELNHVRAYVRIENYHFDNAISLEIDAQEGVEELSCINIILQPFVENAIMYSIARAPDMVECRIRISAVTEGKDLVFCITDNGLGMTAEQVAHIFEENTCEVSHGYGAKNVNFRIKLCYGEEYGVSYESQVGKGTTVTVRLPALTPEEAEKILYIDS